MRTNNNDKISDCIVKTCLRNRKPKPVNINESGILKIRREKRESYLKEREHWRLMERIRYIKKRERETILTNVT